DKYGAAWPGGVNAVRAWILERRKESAPGFEFASWSTLATTNDPSVFDAILRAVETESRRRVDEPTEPPANSAVESQCRNATPDVASPVSPQAAPPATAAAESPSAGAATAKTKAGFPCSELFKDLEAWLGDLARKYSRTWSKRELWEAAKDVALERKLSEEMLRVSASPGVFESIKTRIRALTKDRQAAGVAPSAYRRLADAVKRVTQLAPKAWPRGTVEVWGWIEGRIGVDRTTALAEQCDDQQADELIEAVLQENRERLDADAGPGGALWDDAHLPAEHAGVGL
ncbi:MAG: hypothetical protein ACRDD1_09280, partial [Planctomycetia bacterium]